VAVMGLGLFAFSVGRLLWPEAVGMAERARAGVSAEGREIARGGGSGGFLEWLRENLPKRKEVEETVEGNGEGEGAGEEMPVGPEDSGELVVVLDPGHGGSDPGSVRQGYYEKDINLAVALRVRKRLEAEGVRVEMTRDRDVAMELEDRVAVANRYRNAIFVSIHQNASLETAARGVETYFAWPRPASVTKVQRERYGIPHADAFEDGRGELLAAKVQGAFCAETGALNRGIKNRNFVVIRWVYGPAVLVECGFLSNPAERERLLSGSYQDKVAAGIAGGLLRYVRESGGDPHFGLRFPDGPPPENGPAPRQTVVRALPVP